MAKRLSGSMRMEPQVFRISADNDEWINTNGVGSKRERRVPNEEVPLHCRRHFFASCPRSGRLCVKRVSLTLVMGFNLARASTPSPKGIENK
jgi:hypothetical protein